MNFTDTEIKILREALEMENDMLCDMLFDDLWFSDDEKTFTKEQMKEITKNLGNNIERLYTTRAALAKVGGNVNGMGYSR